MFSSLSIVGVGFALGLLHAFDADHVMAVSALSSRKPGFWRTLRFSANWALGHSGVLILAGLLLFGVGQEIPVALQSFAEASVGVLLIGLGLMCFWRFRQQRLSLKTHTHTYGDSELVHTHWHLEGHTQSDTDAQHNVKDSGKQDSHAPVMVGMLHGLAGSAPALALVPAVAQGQLFLAMLYLLLFSVGVMLSMLVFGSGLGSLQQYLQHKHVRLFMFSRYLVATAAILLGGFWLSQAG
jgi:cytochrome c biogenesis protein CcdA